MSKLKRSPQISKISPLLVTGLMVAGNFQFIPSVLAVGTAAGTTINNTATATFKSPGDDPNAPPRTTTSNTVTITVAEVDGITNVAQTPVDVNGGSIIFNDNVQFPFNVTNTGNNATDIFIPHTVTATNLVSPLVFIDTNNDGTPDYVIDPAAPNKIFNVTVSGGVFAKGSENTSPTGITASPNGAVVTAVAADGIIKVTVQGTVNPAAGAGGLVNAQLGNTGSNDSTNPDSQNQPDAADGQTVTEVRTVGGAPVNGTREAADTSASLVVGTTPPAPLALATVRKTAASVDNKSTAAFDDDEITYQLSLSVENQLPVGFSENYLPANLEGTSISVDSATVTQVLVSDAVPAGTVLTGTPVAPTGWTVVYTNSPLATTATNALWTTTIPTGTITRIGFIFNGTVLKGTTVSGFSFVAKKTANDAGPVYNLAQAFGESEGDPNNRIVFDESGDANPNNFNGPNPPTNNDVTTGNEPYGDYNPTATTGNTGEAGTPPDAEADIDNNNSNNDPTGFDGDPNKLLLNAPPTPPPPGVLLNGPLNNTGAVGQIGNNDDFTSKSINEGVSNSTTNIPTIAPVVFDNSFRNVSGIDLQNIVILPASVTQANAVCRTCDYQIDALPANTRVTVALNVDADAAIEIAIFDLQADGSWLLNTTAGNYTTARDVTGDGVADTVEAYDNPNIAGLINALEVDLVTSGTEVDYNVVIDLPDGTVAPFKGFSVPLVAYVNNDFNDVFAPASETINNITIDNLYTGYLKLSKQARILYADGTSSNFFGIDPVTGASTAEPTRKPAPGDRIQYRITYSNISAAAGTGNAILPATEVVVFEVGTGTFAGQTTNTWGTVTSNATGNTVSSRGSISYYIGDPTQGVDNIWGTTDDGNRTSDVTDVNGYVNVVGTVNPGESGTFTFQRIIK